MTVEEAREVMKAQMRKFTSTPEGAAAMELINTAAADAMKTSERFGAVFPTDDSREFAKGVFLVGAMFGIDIAAHSRFSAKRWVEIGGCDLNTMLVHGVAGPKDENLVGSVDRN